MEQGGGERIQKIDNDVSFAMARIYFSSSSRRAETE